MSLSRDLVPHTVDLLVPLPLASLAASLRSGERDLHGFLADLYDRVDGVDSLIHSLVDERGWRERVRRGADALLERYPRPQERPALFGIPAGVKDIIRVDGLPTRAGSRLPPALFDGNEATVVRRLRAAGALIVGKTVTAEFAVFEPGPTRNPHALDRTPGGSSSGSAAAVAAGLVALALGTQTIGSVIRPAAYCGIVGVKPSAGRMSGDGMVPCSPSLDQPGLFTPQVADAALALGVLCPGWTPYRAGPPPVLGVPDGQYLQQASSEGLAAFESQLDTLRQAGYAVRRIPLLPDIEDINARHRSLMFGEMAAVHREWFARYEALYARRTADLIRWGQHQTHEEIEEGWQGRGALRDTIETALRQHGIDILLSPSATGPAPVGIETTGDPVMNLPWTHAGLPVVSLPAGTVDGLPVGLQLVAAHGRDEALLHWAGEMEKIFLPAHAVTSGPVPGR